jgi:RNA polymerase sigma-70 factor (ECF subfamily)
MDGMTECYDRFLGGDIDAFAEIVSRTRMGLSYYIFTFVRDPDLAEELTEDVFVKLYLRRPANGKKGSFKTWLYTIGRNAALDELRRQKKKNRIPLEEASGLSSGENLPEARYLAEETKRTLHQALGRIPPAYAEALRLAYFEGFTEKEISHIMKRSMKSTYDLLYRAKKALKEQLIKEGFTYEI